MKVFFVLVIRMGTVRKSNLEDYWSTNEVSVTPFFIQYMSKDRFLLISSNLYIVDNDTDDRSDKLFKVRPFLSMLQNNCEKYKPERDLSFDEGLCPFKGRVSFSVYNPMKPNRFGIKLFQFYEASSGYCVGIDVYHGQTDCAQYVEALDMNCDDLTQTTKIVLGMLSKVGLHRKGQHIYMDS